ncbi:MAG: type 2 isopentenyl-diphosphate Delta-isomerase [Chloroflexaceae bacterium]|nr:type 2 isopentenyl-diphosphate Delta-isomerase [Chloroflexaceae bacterium]
MVNFLSDSTTDIENRKAEHLRVCLEESVNFPQTTTGLERYRFSHCCLPELERSQISLQTSFLGRVLRSPLLISSMTGGTEFAKTINQRLARAAQQYGLAMGVGSQRIGLENWALMSTFAVRSQAPDILLLANLGAVQLNYGYAVDECRRAVESLEADGLILHLNPLQESVQSEGDTNFRGILAKIALLCQQLPVPVVVKEVGNGISAAIAEKLLAVGVSAIDVAGAGGTSWARVESQRAKDRRQQHLGQTFADWGLPTADCVVQIRDRFPEVPLIASGGIANGLDAAKAIALGANVVGMARPFLQAAAESETELAEFVQLAIAELETVLFCTGSASLAELQRSGVLLKIN